MRSPFPALVAQVLGQSDGMNKYGNDSRIFLDSLENAKRRLLAGSEKVIASGSDSDVV